MAHSQPQYILTGDTKRTDAVGNVYIHKNDPKVINKGIHLTDARHAIGGTFPILSDTDYNQRKYDNTSYKYDAKTHHGTRPMHKTTFNLGYQTNQNSDLTKNFIDYRGYQLRPEYLHAPAKNQFDHHFDIGTSNQTSFSTHYGSQFYSKNKDKDYVDTFDLMPKYSVQKQLHQLKTDNRIKEYRNRKSNIKEALVVNENEPNYWTQYKRTHDILGHLRGDGVPRNYPDRQAYNILTGETLENPGWSTNINYKRVSGNVVLSDIRQSISSNNLG